MYVFIAKDADTQTQYFGVWAWVWLHIYLYSTWAQKQGSHFFYSLSLWLPYPIPHAKAVYYIIIKGINIYFTVSRSNQGGNNVYPVVGLS